MTKGFGPYFQDIYGENGKTGYVRTHYDTAGLCTGSERHSLKGRNVIGHVRNNFVEAINEYTLLPKVVVVVLDNDIVKSTNHYETGAALAMGPQIDWLATELHRITTAHKERLPTRARKFRYPQFLWVTAIKHDKFSDNEFREKFNDGVVSVAALHREMHVLKLHSWDPMDRNAVSKRRLNAIGQARYWECVNDAFQAWDKEQMRLAQQTRNGK